MSKMNIIVNKCPILLNNGAVIVVKFGNTNVQLPHFDVAEKFVYVSLENGKYRVIDEKTYKEIIENKSLNTKKKNTVVLDHVVIDANIDNANENNEDAVLDETH